MGNLTSEQLILEKQKLDALKLELETKNKQMWAMSETVYKEKKKIEEQLSIMLLEKENLEKQKNENDSNVKQLWEQSTAIHKEKERIEILKADVEYRHQEILDSVQYAKRIQLAILPSEEMVKTYLPNSFVFFQPKNIVSGDFYWVNNLNKNKILFAAVDCTGHGIPGAFMSILAFNLLQQTVKENSDAKPSDLLNELHYSIIKSLKQTNDFDSVKDGMDIALCSIDFENLKLEFAGAHNPLYILRASSESAPPQLIEYKADNKAIGFSYSKKNTFHNHQINLQKGDCLYIFSDGFVDQKGGEKRAKFFYTPFKQLFISIANKPMDEQKYIIETTFNKWKGENKQIDDVLIFGIRI